MNSISTKPFEQLTEQPAYRKVLDKPSASASEATSQDPASAKSARKRLLMASGTQSQSTTGMVKLTSPSNMIQNRLVPQVQNPLAASQRVLPS